MIFKGKGLLFTGGTLFQIPALVRARALGCRIVLVDPDGGTPGRAYADVYEAASTSDIAALLDIAARHRVDAVMTYASDVSVAALASVAEQLGLPGNPPAA